MSPPVSVTFLGGLGEIGRNCAAIEIDGRIMLLDCGLMFPEADMLGLDPPAFRTFADTAAFINNLDLVISVDTAVAHLAGALGRLTWMTIPYHMEWRWWRASEGTGLPWYKTMQVIPQPSVGDWATPIQHYAHQLAAIAAAPYRKV